jgi:hypothetical protein
VTIEDAIASFRELHDKRKYKMLSGDGAARYEALRGDFVRAVLEAQRLTLRPGQVPRQMMRIVHAAKVTITARNHDHDTMTLDLSTAGFAALVGVALAVGTSCDFKLQLGSESVRGVARVVASIRHGSSGFSHRVSFVIQSLTQEHRDRLDIAIIDAALVTLARR